MKLRHFLGALLYIAVGLTSARAYITDFFWVNAPASVASGQLYYISAAADISYWDDGYGNSGSSGSVYLYKNGNYATQASGDYGVGVTYASTDIGAQTVTYDASAYDDTGASASLTHYVNITDTAPTASVSIDGQGYGAVITRPIGGSVTVTVRYSATDPNGDLRWIRPQVWGPGGYFDNSPSDGVPQSGGYGEVVRTVTLDRDGDWYFWSDAQDDEMAPSGNIVSSGAWGSGFKITVVEAQESPTINFTISQTTINIGDTITLTSTASDRNGDLTRHSFWWDQGAGLSWTSPLFDWDYPAKGTGWGNISNQNQEIYNGANQTITATWTAPAPGAYYFHSNAHDSRGYWGNGTTHAVTVVNRTPTNTTSILNSANAVLATNPTGSVDIPFGDTFYIRVVGTDPDGRLAILYSRINLVGNAAGWSYPEVAVSGGSASHDFGPYNTADAGGIGLANVWTHVKDADSVPYDWQGNGWWGSEQPDVNIVKATPAGAFAPQSYTGTYTLSDSDLNATFANPYSGAVTAPSGAISYSIVSASGPDASPTSGTVSIGTTLRPGTYTLRASYAGDGNYHATSVDTVFTILNSPPRVVAMSTSPETIHFGETTTVSATATDGDDNLRFHGLLVLRQDQADWYRGAMCDHSNGWGNHPVTPDILSASYTSGAVSGGNSTRSFVHRPSWVGTQTYHSNTHDGSLWASSDSVNWATCVGYTYCTVDKATPNGVFAARSFTGSRALTAGDLNAAFANPYSGAVAAPTGAISYGIVSASGAGASPTSGEVSVGTTLQPGTYTLRASYSGDGNYHATSVDAVFTLSNQSPTVTHQILDANHNPITPTSGLAPVRAGSAYYIRVTGNDLDGRLTRLYARVANGAGVGIISEDIAVSGASSSHDFGPYLAPSAHQTLDVWSHAQDLDSEVLANAGSPDIIVSNGPTSVTINTLPASIILGQSINLVSSATDPAGMLIGHTFWCRGPNRTPGIDTWGDWRAYHQTVPLWSNWSSPGTPPHPANSTISATFTPNATGYWQLHANAWNSFDVYHPNGATSVIVHVRPPPDDPDLPPPSYTPAAELRVHRP